MKISKRNAKGRISSMNVIERLSKFMGDTEACCWEIPYTSVGSGGHIRVRRDDTQRVFAHRLSWEAYNAEPIPADMLVLHLCDNPRCFNPHHLYLGTQKDNMRDRLNRKGFSSYAHKISKENRVRVAVSTADAAFLAEKYGVTRARILQIWRGEYL